MREVRRQLRERTREIAGYLRMLEFIENAGGSVEVRSRHSSYAVDQRTIHTLKASVFLHLYNLVESTVLAGLVCISDEIKATSTPFHQLDECWQRAWAVSETNLDTGEWTRDSAVKSALRLCKAIADGTALSIRPKLGAGNLDDREIEDLAKRYGITLNIRKPVLQKVKHEVLNDLGLLALVRLKRNNLAHGATSFSDTGRDHSTKELIAWSVSTYRYLKELLGSFEQYLVKKSFKRSG